MYDDTLAAKRAGLRVTLTTPDTSVFDETHDTEMCANCGGLHVMYLQTLVAGPFRSPSQSNPAEGIHVGSHNGGWYKMTLKKYSCPVCAKDIAL